MAASNITANLEIKGLTTVGAFVLFDIRVSDEDVVICDLANKNFVKRKERRLKWSTRSL